MAYVPFRATKKALKKGEKISTREFLTSVGEMLGAGAVVAGGIYGTNRLAYELSVSDANKMLYDFPDEIPGAHKIDKNPIKDAKYCLVHVRQMHDASGLSLEEKKQVREVQDDIYSILSYLVDNAGLDSVYNEATTSETENLAKVMGKIGRILDESGNLDQERTIRERISYLESNLKDDLGIGLRYPDLKDEEAYRAKTRKEIEELKAELPKARAADKKYAMERAEMKLTETAVNKLVKEGRIEAKGAETMLGNVRAVNTLEREGRNSPEAAKAILMDRENILLDLVSKSDDIMPVTVYGGGHSWRNNINDWNKTHPDEKFSLIEITPKAYEKFEKARKK